jgi:hypothetical protein
MRCLSSPCADLLSSHRPHLSSRSAASRANHHRAVKHKSSTPPPPLPRCRSIPFPRFVPMAAAASPQFVSLPCPRCCRTRRVYLCRRRRVYLCRRPAEGAAAARLQCSPAKAVAAEAATVEMGNRIGTVGLPRPDAMGRFRRFGSKYTPRVANHTRHRVPGNANLYVLEDLFIAFSLSLPIWAPLFSWFFTGT